MPSLTIERLHPCLLASSLRMRLGCQEVYLVLSVVQRAVMQCDLEGNCRSGRGNWQPTSPVS